MSECKWCDDGDAPKEVDANGVDVQVSGEPGIWCHTYRDMWWPCPAKAEENIRRLERRALVAEAEVQRLRALIENYIPGLLVVE